MSGLPRYESLPLRDTAVGQLAWVPIRPDVDLGHIWNYTGQAWHQMPAAFSYATAQRAAVLMVGQVMGMTEHEVSAQLAMREDIAEER